MGAADNGAAASDPTSYRRSERNKNRSSNSTNNIVNNNKNVGVDVDVDVDFDDNDLHCRNQESEYDSESKSDDDDELGKNRKRKRSTYHDTQWSEKFKLLKAYRKKKGDTNVPQNCEADPELAVWLRHQRNEYKAKKLDSERIIKLNSIGFVWDVQDAAWTTRYNELKSYQSEHNNSTKVSRYHGENIKLGDWVQDQRKRSKNDTLSKDRKVLLTKIGFFNKSTTRK